MIAKIMDVVRAIGGWVKTIPSEPNGNGSSSRVIALVVSGTLMGLMISYFRVKHDLPSPDQLYGLAAILGTGVGGYVANRFRKHGPNGEEEPAENDDTHS
jgi:hypothetical protein